MRGNGSSRPRKRPASVKAGLRPVLVPVFWGGYTFVEVLVAIVIGALTLSVAVAALAGIVRHSKSSGGTVAVTIGSANAANFFGINTNTIDVPAAPSFDSSAQAEVMRALFGEDIDAACAVFVLARNSLNTIRPTAISNFSDALGKRVSSPEAFRQYIDSGGAVYGSYSGAATNFNNSTVYVLAPSASPGTVSVRAIYESDIVQVSSPPGYYASVRRYVGSSFSDYYHVFFAADATVGGDTNSFLPTVAYFGRSVATNGNAVADLFCTASNRPFYFVWWPDPAARKLDNTDGIPPVPGSTSPRYWYYQMAGRTPLFMVVPAFPAL